MLEATIVFNIKDLAIVANWADSLGWEVTDSVGAFCTITMRSDSEQHLLECLKWALLIFPDEGAVPVSSRIIRVIWDEAAGIDEITPNPDDWAGYMRGAVEAAAEGASGEE